MKALFEPLWDEVVLAWRRGGAPVRAAAVVGVLLMLVGVLHGVAFVVLGGPWQGAVAWRKPFAFGLSFGMTTVTVAWIVSRLRVGQRWRWWLNAAVALSATVEVGWVSVQRARGVASHFNMTTTADALAFSLAGGGAIAVMVTALVVVTVLMWTHPDAPPALRTAIRSGLAVLLVAQAVGGWMIQRGIESAVGGAAASHAIGAAGDLKIVHALAMHGVQVLPVIALWLLAGTTTSQAHQLTRVAAGGYALVTAAALVHAASGRAATDPTAVAASLATAGLVVVAVPALVAISHAEPRLLVDER